MKLVFMGTPDFAKTVLEDLVNAGHEIVAVYTQPDKPKGRSSELIASPVKEYAIEKNIAVYQPVKIKEAQEVERLRTFDAEAFIVAAFGQFLSTEILEMPKYGCINVHGSLLPKYRGAAPIQRAIVNGEKETGVTIMQMDKGMDSGDIISQVKVEITRDDNETSMYEKLAIAGGKLLIETLGNIEELRANRTKQNPDEVTFAPSMTKEEGEISLDATALEIEHKVKGFSVWPVAYLSVNGKNLKIYDAHAICKEDEEYQTISSDIKDMGSGCFAVTKKHLYLTTREGLLELLEVQPEGKKRMKAMDYANGQRLVNGMSIG